MENVNKQLLDALSQLDLAETEVTNAKAWSAGEQAKAHCDFALTAIATARQAIAAAPQTASCLPSEMTPAMMRAVQMRSELGAYAAANLAGAYDLFAKFWRVAAEEVKKGGA